MNPAGMALDGGDPRLSVAGEGIADYSRRQITNNHDKNVTFDEYLYYAAISRADESRYGGGNRVMSILPGKFGKKHQADFQESPGNAEPLPSKETAVDGEGAGLPPGPPAYLGRIDDEEWLTASRAARTATWGAVFYLITTDILGPYSVPWAMSQMGYGPGVVLYTIFGLLAGYTGWQLWRMFLRLDSDRYPLKSYGDIAFRIYGTWARHSVNLLQSIQLLFNVGVIILANGQGLSQVVNDKVCFIVLCIVWTIAGGLLGQVRTLQKFGWIANLAIWINLIVLFLTMGVVAHYPPNYEAAVANDIIPDLNNPPPITTTGGAPEGVEFTGQIVGLMQAVYSYGGAMLFCEFMSEMKRPWDFWKGMLCAQLVIYTAYMTFGLYVYSFQGQYTVNPANQGMSPYNFQTAGNILNLLASLIAAALYGNIGIKVIYQNVIMELLKAPPLTEKKGKLIWVGMVPAYWLIAFVIAAAVPQFSNISALVAAVCILQFTYTFPPLLMLGFEIQQHALQAGEGFDPITGRVTRYDSGMKRWARGMKRQWYIKLWNLGFCLGAAVCAVLGAYSAVKGLISGFAGTKAASSFGCASPVGG